MPSEFEARRQIVEIGRRIWQRGYVAANDGNLSVRLSDDRILVTPTGVSKGFLRLEELAIVNARGRQISGARAPSSELPMHLFVYERRRDVDAIVHAHPPRATGFAVAGVPLAQCVLPEVILTLGQVPLTDYATPSTPEVPESIDAFIGNYNALLLRNHGVLTLGADIDRAYFRLETVEHFAEITLSARILGGASPLTRDEVRKLLDVREKLGLADGAASCFSCGACDTSDSEEKESQARTSPPARTTADQETPSTAGAGPAAPPRTSGQGSPDEAIVQAVIREVQKALGKG